MWFYQQLSIFRRAHIRNNKTKAGYHLSDFLVKKKFICAADMEIFAFIITLIPPLLTPLQLRNVVFVYCSVANQYLWISSPCFSL